MTSGAPFVIPATPSVWIDGQVNPSLGAGLLNLEVSDSVEGLCHAEVSVGNWGSVAGSIGFLYFDRQTLEFGKGLQIKFGPAGSEATIFDGRISGLEAQFPSSAPPAITVLAEDRYQELRMMRRTRVFENVNDTDVFQQIASEHGLTPDVQFSGPTHQTLTQVNRATKARRVGRASDTQAGCVAACPYPQSGATLSTPVTGPQLVFCPFGN